MPGDNPAAFDPEREVTSKEAPRIAGMFDAIAGRYDLLNHLLSAGLDRRWRARAIGELRLHGSETVLDVCTGTADLALAARRGARRVIGVDFSGAMLERGRGKVRADDARTNDQAPAPVQLIRGDAVHLPFAGGTVDAATMAFGIRNVERPEEACREIARVLGPGGRLVILEFSLPRAPVVRGLYLWYFRRVLPIVGRAVSKHPSAYTYLPLSVAEFPAPPVFVQQLRAWGFASARAIPLAFGIVQMFVATKEPPGAASA